MTESAQNKGRASRFSLDRQGRAPGKILGPMAAIAVAALLVFSGCSKPASTTATSTTGTTAVTTATTSATALASPAPTLKPTTTTSATAAPKPVTPAGPSGDLRVALSTFGGETFYPATAIWSTVSMTLPPMFDFLFVQVGMAQSPGLVEKWSMAPDGLSWTYNIRRGVKFHDGTEMKAEDVKFSMEEYARPTSSDAFLRDMIDHIDLVDPYSIRVFTKGTQPYLSEMSTFHSPSQGAVVPKAYVQQNGVDYYQTRPVGTGPFKFVSRLAGDSIQYQAVDSHWKRVPAFKNLKLVLMPEEATRIAALKTGEIDATDLGLEAANGLAVAGFRTPALDVVMAEVRFYHSYVPEAAGLPGANVKVRQALSLAINRDEINKKFLFGKAGPVYIPGLAPGAADTDTDYWLKYSANAYRYDPQEATRLLKEAGYPNGFSIKLYGWPLSGAPYLPALGEVIAGYWTKIGVQASPVPMDYAIFTGWARQQTPRPEMLGQASMWRTTNNPVTPKPLQGPYISSGTWRLVGKAMPELEKLTNIAYAEPDAAKRKETIAKASQMIIDTWTDLPLGTVPMMAALGPRVNMDLPKPAVTLSFYLDIAEHAKP